MTEPHSAPIGPVRWSQPSEHQALEELDRIVSALPGKPFLEVPERSGAHAWLFGDTHGDWPTAQRVLEAALRSGEGRDRAIFLGDYVDRTPPELPHGSVLNALSLLSAAATLPDRVVLLRGNHETQRQIPGILREAAVEARSLWGERTPMAERLEDAFGRLPLAALLSSGVYLAHAGFPRTRSAASLPEEFARTDDGLLFEVVWNDVLGSPVAGSRGIPCPPFTEEEVGAFLRSIEAEIFVRAHDPYLAGQWSLGGKVLTLHTTRVFLWAGLWRACVPLSGRVGPGQVRLEPVEPAPLPPPSS